MNQPKPDWKEQVAVISGGADGLGLAGKLMTYEVGIRFLTDYLQGDIYFKTKRPGHNLDRARNQLRLVERIEAVVDAMSAIVAQSRLLSA